jgi:hypothetical protein
MFLRALSAETLKYRRTSALFLAVGVPVAINLLFLLVYALTPRLQALPINGRWEVFLSGGISTWTQLFLPLGLGILAALALNLEHGDNQWKHVLVLGPSRVAVYLAKAVAVAALVLLGSVALAVSAFLVGGAVTGFQNIPWSEIVRGPALTFVGALGIVAVQTWLATRFKAFGASLGVALFGAILGTLAAQSQTYWRYVPWAYPSSALTNTDLALVLSGTVALVVTLLAAWDFNRRDMV